MPGLYIFINYDGKYLIGGIMREKHYIIAVLLLFIFYGCGKSNSYSPEQAVNHIGKKVTITGKVYEVYTTRRGTTFLDFGGRYPDNPFTAVIFRNKRSGFGNVYTYQGKKISVTGVVTTYRGKPEIILDSKGQINY